MKSHYSEFILSYFRWYNRMSTSPDDPKYNPCLSLSALQAINIFSLSMLLPSQSLRAISPWVLVTLFFLFGAVCYWLNRKIFVSIVEVPRFSRLTDNVPGIREFPKVYGYLVLTLGLLFLPVWVH